MIAKENLPNKKVTAGSTGGAITVLIVWAAGQFGIEVPPEIAAVLTTLVSSLAGYFTPETITKIVETVTDAVEDQAE